MAINYTTKKSTEHQHHGKEFEMRMIEKYNLEGSTSQTAKWDAYYNGIPVSIKCAKITKDGAGSVGLGDIYRQTECTEGFYMIIGWWSEAKGKNTIVKEDIMYIPAGEWHKHFYSDILDDCTKLLAKVSFERSWDAAWKKLIAKLKATWDSNTDGYISIAPKRDHHGAKRVQCCIKNAKAYNSLYTQFNTSFAI